MSAPRFRHDPDADAIYVYLQDIRMQAGTVARTEVLDDQRTIDYAQDGSVIGIEFQAVSDGVNLRDIPSAVAIAQLLAGEVEIYAA